MKQDKRKNSQQSLQAEQSEKISNSLGDMLAKARMELKLTTGEAAQQLHLTTAIIEYLESDNYISSKKDVFYRGYLRGYAKLLQLSVDKAVELYNQAIKHDGIKISENHEFNFSFADKSPIYSKSIWWISLGVLIAFIVGIGLWRHAQQRFQEIGKIQRPLAPVESSSETLLQLEPIPLESKPIEHEKLNIVPTPIELHSHSKS